MLMFDNTKISKGSIMKFLAKLLIVNLILYSINVKSEELNFIPLEIYISKNDMKDSVSRIYVFNRCAGLFLMYANQSSNRKNNEMEQLSIKSKDKALLFFANSSEIAKKIYKDNYEKINSEMLKQFSETYSSVAEKLILEGKGFGNLIINDTKVCGDVSKAIEK